ncbi:MAG: hypothetical protein KAZ30_01790 [Candidatus Magasanikbacteria bacterium]|nr:hypothetical protein [Candidatus Magasanikbacteria bacterium]
MKYKLLTIVGAAILLSGCGQTNALLTREEMNVKEDMEQASFEAKMLAENGEPTFEDLVKTAPKDENGNIILTAPMRYLFPGCDKTESGFIPSDISVKYSNLEKGIEFNVPYNQNWHFCGYRLAPYDVVSKDSGPYVEFDSVEFGSLTLAPESGHSLVRSYYLYFMPTSTPEKLKVLYRDSLAEHTQVKINNLSVVREYSPPPTDGMGCSWLSYYVLGQKATYRFSGYCVETEIGDQKYSADKFSKELEQIIKTIKLI